MEAVLITVYLIIVLALIAVILLQRSEGGGLGMGGNSSGVLAVRGQANLLTRTTWVTAGIFLFVALVLAIVSSRGAAGPDSLLQREFQQAPAATPTPLDLPGAGGTEGQEPVGLPGTEQGAANTQPGEAAAPTQP